MDVNSKIGFEIKSVKFGSGIIANQLKKDGLLTKRGWEIRYIFGQPPSAADEVKLKKAGVRWDVRHAIGEPVDPSGRRDRSSR